MSKVNILHAFGVLNIGKNGTIGRQIPATFRVLPMVKSADLPIVPLVTFLPIMGNGNPKTLIVFLLPMVPLVDHMMEFL